MRRHPLRRIVLSTAATVSGVVLLLSLKPHAPQQAVAASAGSSAPASSSGTSAGTSASASARPRSSAGASRSVDGDTVQTRYGPVQVRITLKSGRITAVDALQVPSENPRDQEIAQFSVPQLTQETLDHQSSGIDTVSGATYTSMGYIRSLQSALDKAGV